MNGVGFRCFLKAQVRWIAPRVAGLVWPSTPRSQSKTTSDAPKGKSRDRLREAHPRLRAGPRLPNSGRVGGSRRHRCQGLEVIARIDGRGFGVRREDMWQLLRETQGKSSRWQRWSSSQITRTWSTSCPRLRVTVSSSLVTLSGEAYGQGADLAPSQKSSIFVHGGVHEIHMDQLVPADTVAETCVRRGVTAHCVVTYDQSLGANGQSLADAVLAGCEADYKRLQRWFGNISIGNLPFDVFITPVPRPVLQYRGRPRTRPPHHWGSRDE
jgi:hypothetical protein